MSRDSRKRESFLREESPTYSVNGNGHQNIDTTIAELQILTGDCRKIVPSLPTESVQCCVTSPPYWGLRDYANSAQIGAESTPDHYVKNLVEIFRAIRRVLKSDGTVWLNVGDGYARNGGTGNHGPNAIVGNTRKLIQKRNCKVPACWGLKDRDLMGLPWRVAFALQEDGWILRSKITWLKKTAMPESVKNRPTSATEEIFLFSKKPTYFYNPEGVRESSGANLRNCWILGPDISGKGHPATFPRELARRCILLGSRPGDAVLDPFGGSGTTGAVAQELGRRAILIELNPEYSKMSKERIRYAIQDKLRF
jgi:DNA modification methylase